MKFLLNGEDGNSHRELDSHSSSEKCDKTVLSSRRSKDQGEIEKEFDTGIDQCLTYVNACISPYT